MVGGEGGFDAVGGQREGGDGHDAGVVDQDVDGGDGGVVVELAGGGADRGLTCEVHDQGVVVDVGIGGSKKVD